MNINKDKLISILKNARIKKGLTQKEVSLMLGFNERYYQQIELGNKLPSIPTLESLARLLDINLGDLEEIKEE